MSHGLAPRQVNIQGNTDTSFLKLLALVFMIIDHSGKMLFPQIHELRLLGRIAFPLYAWCLVVGSEYTRNEWRYALRIAVIGLVSQPFFMAGLGHTWTEPNIFLTLLLGLLGIIALKEKQYFSHIWGPVLVLVLGAILNPDYGWKGVFFVLILYGARKSRSALAVTFLTFCLFWGSGGANTTFFGWTLPMPDNPDVAAMITPFLRTQTMAWMALPLMVFPTNTHWKLPKWLGYSAYPLHLAILAVIVHYQEIAAWASGLFA